MFGEFMFDAIVFDGVCKTRQSTQSDINTHSVINVLFILIIRFRIKFYRIVKSGILRSKY
jgi:hypothetical protein